jgi:hypothetical protein
VFGNHKHILAAGRVTAKGPIVSRECSIVAIDGFSARVPCGIQESSVGDNGLRANNGGACPGLVFGVNNASANASYFF